MNFFALITILMFLGAFFAFYLKLSSLSAVLEWTHARPCPRDPLWTQVKELLSEIAREQRVACPEIMVLPEFSPNALVLSGKKSYILLSDGMVRSLSKSELQAALSLSLTYSQFRGSWILTRVGLLMFPLANTLQTSPLVIQYLFFPVLSLLMRIWVRPEAVKKADLKAAKQVGTHEIIAVLQKLSVLGRKIPVRRWNIALDHLFLLSPLVLEKDPLWLFPSQPSIEQRRQFLVTCESAPSLP